MTLVRDVRDDFKSKGRVKGNPFNHFIFVCCAWRDICKKPNTMTYDVARAGVGAHLSLRDFWRRAPQVKWKRRVGSGFKNFMLQSCNRLGFRDMKNGWKDFEIIKSFISCPKVFVKHGN